MTSETASRLKDELLAQEQAYVRAMHEQDGAAAARLTATESLMVSGGGAMKIDGAAVKQMIEESDSTRRFEIDESSIEVVEVTDDVAIIAYKLRTTDGAETSDAYDADVWVRRQGQWACALHADIPAIAK